MFKNGPVTGLTPPRAWASLSDPAYQTHRSIACVDGSVVEDGVDGLGAELEHGPFACPGDEAGDTVPVEVLMKFAPASMASRAARRTLS
jgi:hypothetical protein